MGLFSKDKKTEESAMPPMPPAPQSETPATGNGLPPAPAPAPAQPGQPAPPQPQQDQTIPVGSSLVPPALPGGSLDEIKSQVVGNEPSTPTAEPIPEIPSKPENVYSPTEISTDEDLFDMFQVEDEELPQTPTETTSLDKSVKQMELSDLEEQDDPLMEHETQLNFESNPPKSSESKFLTTSQFKALLEVVDSVKGKIKNSTETHIRLMDMKAEEDAEYEMLRKNFQFIENKLYELDGILFEK